MSTPRTVDTKNPSEPTDAIASASEKLAYYKVARNELKIKYNQVEYAQVALDNENIKEAKRSVNIFNPWEVFKSRFSNNAVTPSVKARTGNFLHDMFDPFVKEGFYVDLEIDDIQSHATGAGIVIGNYSAQLTDEEQQALVKYSGSGKVAERQTFGQMFATLTPRLSPWKLLNPFKVAQAILSTAANGLRAGIEYITGDTSNKSKQNVTSSFFSRALKTLFVTPIIAANAFVSPFANIEKLLFIQKKMNAPKTALFNEQKKLLDGKYPEQAKIVEEGEKNDVLRQENSKQRSMDKLFERRSSSTSALSSVMSANTSSTAPAATTSSTLETSSSDDDQSFEQSSATFSEDDYSSLSSTPEDKSPILLATEADAKEAKRVEDVGPKRSQP